MAVLCFLASQTTEMLWELTITATLLQTNTIKIFKTNQRKDELGSDVFYSFSHSCSMEKGVYRMDVAPSDRPVYAKIGKGVASESFYIRSGATNQHLGFGAALKYIVRRFPHELLND